MEHVVANLDELPSGVRKTVHVGGREICLFNIGGEIYAVWNRCPHQGGPVCSGGLFEHIVADVTTDRRLEERIESDGYILACPWHGWEYDVRTGACLWNPVYRLRRYNVAVDAEGNLVLDL